MMFDSLFASPVNMAGQSRVVGHRPFKAAARTADEKRTSTDGRKPTTQQQQLLPLASIDLDGLFPFETLTA